jgi:hypothetical protein
VIGNTFDASYRYPDANTIYPDASRPPLFVAGEGVDATINVEDVTQVAIDMMDTVSYTTGTTVFLVFGDRSRSGARTGVGRIAWHRSGRRRSRPPPPSALKRGLLPRFPRCR